MILGSAGFQPAILLVRNQRIWQTRQSRASHYISISTL